MQRISGARLNCRWPVVPSPAMEISHMGVHPPAAIVRTRRYRALAGNVCRSSASGRRAHNIRAVSVDLGTTSAGRRSCRAVQEEIAALIRRTREECGLTQHELGQRMRRAQSEVARWESGEHAITFANLERIADALGVELTVRFGTKEPM